MLVRSMSAVCFSSAVDWIWVHWVFVISSILLFDFSQDLFRRDDGAAGMSHQMAGGPATGTALHLQMNLPEIDLHGDQTAHPLGQFPDPVLAKRPYRNQTQQPDFPFAFARA